MIPKADCLRTISVFAQLPRETRDAIARVAVPRTYGSDETIIFEGDPCTAAYFLDRGHVRVARVSAGGREQVLARLGPGQSFNTVPLFQRDGVNHATVGALDEVRVYAVAKEDLIALLRSNPELGLALLRDFADRLDHLTDLVEDLSLRTVRGRLARFLLEQAEADAVSPRMTQAEIAARLGTVREVIGRTLRDLADDHLIRMERGRIVLLNRDGLEHEVHG